MGSNQSNPQSQSATRSPQPSPQTGPQRSPNPRPNPNPNSGPYAAYYPPGTTVVGPLPPGYPTPPHPPPPGPTGTTYPYVQYYPYYGNGWGGYGNQWYPPPSAAPYPGQWPAHASAARVAVNAPPPIIEEAQETETIRNSVNVQRNSLRLVEDPADASKRVLTFTLDAEVDGR